MRNINNLYFNQNKINIINKDLILFFNRVKINLEFIYFKFGIFILEYLKIFQLFYFCNINFNIFYKLLII